jgi:hypothetical protein
MRGLGLQFRGWEMKMVFATRSRQQGSAGVNKPCTAWQMAGTCVNYGCLVQLADAPSLRWYFHQIAFVIVVDILFNYGVLCPVIQCFADPETTYLHPTAATPFRTLQELRILGHSLNLLPAALHIPPKQRTA